MLLLLLLLLVIGLDVRQKASSNSMCLGAHACRQKLQRVNSDGFNPQHGDDPVNTVFTFSLGSQKHTVNMDGFYSSASKTILGKQKPLYYDSFCRGIRTPCSFFLQCLPHRSASKGPYNLDTPASPGHATLTS